MFSTPQTLSAPISFEGIGVHTGTASQLIIAPAVSGTGLVFQREDISGQPRIPVAVSSVDPQLCQRSTSLYQDGVRVQTTEHVLSALFALGITDAILHLSGPEVPFLDGSAQAFVVGLAQSGVVLQPASHPTSVRVIKVLKPLVFREDSWRYTLLPSEGFTATYIYASAEPQLRYQIAEWAGQNYEQEIAPARTFGFLSEVGPLMAQGLVRGASLANSVVFGKKSVLNTDLRFPNEPARHKLLDLIGDLAPLGLPLAARMTAFKTGHYTNALLVRWLQDLINTSEYDGVRVEPYSAATLKRD
jgi:UDP-3-O-acyl N-acetylglucosamine deacetylase